MKVFAQDNLYDNSPLSKSSAAASSIQIAPELSQFDILLNYINAFLIAWCIFYSVLFILDFFYFKVYFHYDKIDREKIGIASLNRAIKIWLTYLIFWFFYALYVFIPIISFLFGLIAIVVAIAKVILFDVPLILDIVWNLHGNFHWFLNIKSKIQEKLKLPLKK